MKTILRACTRVFERTCALRSTVSLVVKYYIDKIWLAIVNGRTHGGEMDREMH